MGETINCQVPTIARFCCLYLCKLTKVLTDILFAIVCWVFRFPTASFKWIYQQMCILKRNFCVFYNWQNHEKENFDFQSNFLTAKMLDLLMKIWKLRVWDSLFHFFHVICKISNFNMWTAKHLVQASCTELTLTVVMTFLQLSYLTHKYWHWSLHSIENRLQP